MTRPETVPTYSQATDDAFRPRRAWTERPSLKSTLGPAGNVRLAVIALVLGDIVASLAALVVLTFIPFVAVAGWIVASLAVSVCVVLGLYMAGTYNSKGFRDAKSLTTSLSIGLFMSALLLAVVDLVWPSSLLNAQAIALFFLLATPLLFSWRFAGVRRARMRFAPNAVAIVGNGTAAHRLADILADCPSFRLAMTLSPLSDRAVQIEGPERQTTTARIADLPSVISGAAVRLVAVADSTPNSQVAIVRQLRRCRSAGVDVQDVATCIEMLSQRVPVRHLQKWRKPSISFPGWERTFDDKLKRFIDVLLSVVAMAAAAPVMLVAAAIVRWSDGGPALYTQTRVGTGGRSYTLYKFRSMRVDAEREGEAVWATENDPRVTKAGRLLRKLHLDELPQLWNVFRGDMSLVGPRPERPEFVGWLRLAIPHYDARHAVRPGITGWAQIRYPYGASAAAAEAKLEYDLYYVRHRNVLWDLYILFQTVMVVFKGAQS